MELYWNFSESISETHISETHILNIVIIEPIRLAEREVNSVIRYWPTDGYKILRFSHLIVRY